MLMPTPTMAQETRLADICKHTERLFRYGFTLSLAIPRNEWQAQLLYFHSVKANCSNLQDTWLSRVGVQDAGNNMCRWRAPGNDPERRAEGQSERIVHYLSPFTSCQKPYGLLFWRWRRSTRGAWAGDRYFEMRERYPWASLVP
jgi:hypothetical protein